MKHWQSTGFARAAVLFGLLAGSTGCVTSGAHDAVVQQRDKLSIEQQRLSERVDQLETANASLSAERLALIDQNEELRTERNALRSEASRLTNQNQELAETLEVTTSEVVEKRAEVNRLKETYQGLVSDLQSEVAAGQIEIEQLREGVRLNVSDEILFASGSATLDRIGQDVLDKVAKNLAKGDFRIEVQGHTDSIPIRGALTKQYPTNWELAGARASRVVRLFREAGVDGSRLQAVSFAEYAPVAPNDTAENRWLNRRIEIRLHPIDQPLAIDAEAPPAEGSGAPDGSGASVAR